MEEEKKTVKKITLGTILSWGLGIIFLIASITTLFSNILTALLSLVIAFLLLPPANKLMEDKFNFTLSKGLKIVLFIVLMALMVSTLPKSEDPENTSESENSQEQTEETNDNKEDAVEGSFGKPFGMDQRITVGEVEWVITKAENLGSTLKSKYGSYGDDCVANSGSFIRIDFKVKNISKDMITLTDLYLYDSSEREFTSSSEVYSCVEDELFLLDNINPGIEKTFTVVYEVPEDAEDLKIKVEDLKLFGDGEAYVDLGL
jgi:hypothetical protein